MIHKRDVALEKQKSVFDEFRGMIVGYIDAFDSNINKPSEEGKTGLDAVEKKLIAFICDHFDQKFELIALLHASLPANSSESNKALYHDYVIELMDRIFFALATHNPYPQIKQPSRNEAEQRLTRQSVDNILGICMNDGE